MLREPEAGQEQGRRDASRAVQAAKASPGRAEAAEASASPCGQPPRRRRATQRTHDGKAAQGGDVGQVSSVGEDREVQAGSCDLALLDKPWATRNACAQRGQARVRLQLQGQSQSAGSGRGGGALGGSGRGGAAGGEGRWGREGTWVLPGVALVGAHNVVMAAVAAAGQRCLRRGGTKERTLLRRAAASACAARMACSGRCGLPRRRCTESTSCKACLKDLSSSGM